MYTRHVLILLSAATVLVSCGGGGGGNSPVAPAPFTSFSAVQNGQPVQASGMSQTVNATLNPFDIVTSTSVNGVDTANSNAQMTYTNAGGNRVPSAFSYSAPGTSAGWSGTNVTCGSPGCAGGTANSVGAIINALDPAVGWNYQSFGYWLVGTTASTAMAGAMSFGSPTPVAGLPTTGTAIYTGQSMGTYVDPGGNLYIYRASMSANVDFGALSVGFSTSGTMAAPVSTGVIAPMPSLDLSGPNLTINPGTGQFAGPVQAPAFSPALSGTATGRFYGPTAEEIGGVYALTGPNPHTMLGAFGGKR